MVKNRSMPPGTVIPEIHYPDVNQAAEWLSGAFGFAKRLRIGSHRVQLTFGEGSVVAVSVATEPISRSSLMVRVEDVDAHHERARKHGARILRPPADYPFGERQYTAADPVGHEWTFSQSIADVDPSEWGGAPIEAR
jgi:uncharacterized glyoxalase superfamily protein PhnB